MLFHLYYTVVIVIITKYEYYYCYTIVEHIMLKTIKIKKINFKAEPVRRNEKSVNVSF